MSLSSRISRSGGVVPPEPRRLPLRRCHYCPFADPDPETVFGHMQRRECRQTGARWMRRLADHPLDALRRD